jgi:hypothetical protein
MKNNKVILEFEDVIPNKNTPDTFKRKVVGKGQEYHFEKGQLLVKFIERSTSYLKAIELQK